MDRWMGCWIADLAPIWRTGFCSHLSLFLGVSGRERELAAIPRAGLFATWHGVLSCRLSLFFLCNLGGVFTPLNCVLLRAKLSTLFNPRCRDSFSAYLANL